MPTLCMFFGIVVKMYAESGAQHNLPHIHAEYQGAKVVVDLDGNVIEGKFPGSKMRLLLAWIEIHHDELMANWELLSNGEGYFKIDPLR